MHVASYLPIPTCQALNFQNGPPIAEKPQSTDDCWHLIVNPRVVERKRFGLFGGVSGKRINMRSREAAQNLARKIWALQNEQQEHAAQ